MRCIIFNERQQGGFLFMEKKMSTKNLVICALMAAIIVVLQYMGSFIKLGPFSVSLVLVPIVVGSAICGKSAGAILGAVFGLVVMATDTAAFVAVNAPATFLTVMLKGVLSGFFAGLVYSILKNQNRYLAVISSAIVCPVINTGIFLICCKLFFMSLINQWATELGFPSAGNYMIFGLAGGNFIFELIINIIFSPIIVKLINSRIK